MPSRRKAGKKTVPAVEQAESFEASAERQVVVVVTCSWAVADPEKSLRFWEKALNTYSQMENDTDAVFSRARIHLVLAQASDASVNEASASVSSENGSNSHTQQAISLFSRLVTYYDTNPCDPDVMADTRFNLAQSLSDPLAALSHLSVARELYTNSNDKIDACLAACRVQLASCNSVGAAEMLAAAAGLGASSAEFHLLSAQCRIAESCPFLVVVEAFKTVINLHPECVEAYTDMADYLRDVDPQQALALYTHAYSLEKSPEIAASINEISEI